MRRSLDRTLVVLHIQKRIADFARPAGQTLRQRLRCPDSLTIRKELGCTPAECRVDSFLQPQLRCWIHKSTHGDTRVDCQRLFYELGGRKVAGKGALQLALIVDIGSYRTYGLCALCNG